MEKSGCHTQLHMVSNDNQNLEKTNDAIPKNHLNRWMDREMDGPTNKPTDKRTDKPNFVGPYWLLPGF